MRKFLTVTLSMVLITVLTLLLGATIVAAVNGVWAVFVADALCLLLATPSAMVVIKSLVDLLWY